MLTSAVFHGKGRYSVAFCSGSDFADLQHWHIIAALSRLLHWFSIFDAQLNAVCFGTLLPQVGEPCHRECWECLVAFCENRESRRNETVAGSTDVNRFLLYFQAHRASSALDLPRRPWRMQQQDPGLKMMPQNFCKLCESSCVG